LAIVDASVVVGLVAFDADEAVIGRRGLHALVTLDGAGLLERRSGML
jgi:hypothetical protein